MGRPDHTYICIWEFFAVQGCENDFEAAYGSDGLWAKLFKKGDGYIKTELLRDLRSRSRYITVDYWVSKAASENFKTVFEKEYSELDKICEAYTEKESCVGYFFTA